MNSPNRRRKSPNRGTGNSPNLGKKSTQARRSRPNADCGTLKLMETVMESADFADRSGSSRNPAESNSARSRRSLSPNSDPAPVEDAGQLPEPTLSFLNALLTQLQSQLSEINERAGSVRLFQRKDGLGILLMGVSLCPRHQVMHSGQTCPMCPTC